jgi:1-aminocyclopropane-1-carboxylate deaminase/D-cysteine desulfhydrase-like pyridoxal-dependent ACC family enzyme
LMNGTPNRKKAQKPVLFEYFPELEKAVSWVPLGNFPTPVHQLTNLGHSNLWIKRDDLSSPLYGGNKVRKLEFVLGDVKARGKKEVVTIGGIGTNHGLATAIYCHRLGLDATLIVFDQPVTRFVRQNLLLFQKHKARLVYAQSLVGASVKYYITERLKRPDAYFLYAGGSSPVGTLGFVNAAFELKKQIERGQMPEPRYIICPLGSNGTMAGLALGPLHLATARSVRSLMQRTYRLLKSGSPAVPDVTLGSQRVFHEYFGGEYGLPTAEGMEALRLFGEREGIKLEPTYTAKTCACLLDFIKEPARAGDAVLYWHTYNSADLSRDAGLVDCRELPHCFQNFFDGEPVV